MEIRKLNTLRGIAALIVVVSHYSNATNIFGGILGHGAGHVGVMLFFVLSGFLISYLYMHRTFDRTGISAYAVARLARVVPLFLAVVLCSYALASTGTKGVLYNIPTEASLFAHLTLLTGISVLWTIPAEIQFYALFVLLWWLSAKRRGYLYIFLAALFLILVFLDFPRPKGDILGIPYHISMFRALPYFIAGLLFGQLYRKWRPPAGLVRDIFVLSLLIILLLYPKIFSGLTGYAHGMWNDLGVLSAVSLVFFCITFLVPDDNALLANRVGDFLGRISYSTYLLHMPVLWQLEKYADRQPVLFLFIFVATTLAVSFVSYSLIENPSRRLIRSIASRRRAAPEESGRPAYVAQFSANGDTER